MSPLALVTGATGFIGSHMVEVLRKEGWQVRATDLPHQNIDSTLQGQYPAFIQKLGIEFIPSDLTHGENLKELVEGVDFVFHIASIFSYSIPWETLYQVNVEGTRKLLEALRKTKSLKKIILWGAGGIYQTTPSELPIRENTPIFPLNAYLRSKWEQEQLTQHYFKEYHLPYVSIRPTGVYGPRGIYGMGKLIRDLAQMKKISIPKNFTARMPLVHVEDVCRAALFLAQKENNLGEAYNLVDDVNYNNVDFFKMISELAHKPFRKLPKVPIQLAKRGAQAAAVIENFVSSKILHQKPKIEKDSLVFLGLDLWYTNEKLKQTGFTFKYPNSRKGIEETLNWYRENRLI